MKRLSLLLFTTLFALGACGGATTAGASPTTAGSPMFSAAPTQTAQPLDMTAVVSRFLATIPDKYYAVGTVDALKEAIAGGALLIDVREPSEYAAGHIPNAINVPLRRIGKDLDLIPADRMVIVYCKSGYRGSLATGALQALGYSNVRNFVPALPGWQAAEQPVATDAVVPVKMATRSIDPQLVVAVDRYLTAIPDNSYAVATIDAFKAMNGATLVDVREPSEYASGRIPGAINIPIRSLASDLARLPRDVPIVLYCASNQRAGMSLVALGLLGYTNARVFTVNYTGWKAAGEKIVQ